STFPCRLGRKERVEQLLPHLGRDAGAVVANPDFDSVTEVLSRGGECRRVVASICFGLTLGGRIEPVGDQVEQGPGNLLREKIDVASGRVKGPFKGDSEALLLSPRPVIGEIEALIDQRVDIDGSVFARTFTRVQQHVLDDGVGAPAVLYDLAEIVA